MLPLLIQVLASFTKADGVILEEEIDSSLGFLRYDYPEAVYSELRQLFRQALYEQQDLSAMAQKLAASLSVTRPEWERSIAPSPLKILIRSSVYEFVAQAMFSRTTEERLAARMRSEPENCRTTFEKAPE